MANAEDSNIDLTIENRTKDFVELHEQVEGSLTLLSSLEDFLGTFQNDLKAVSGHIADLQTRSKDFDARLRGRRKVSLPLTTLISEITIPPELVAIILETPVTDKWIPAVQQLEALIDSIAVQAHAGRLDADSVNVKAAKDLEGVAEGLRIAATTKIRAHFLSLLQPLRTSVTTNIHVLQASILVGKFLPLYRFLQRRAKSTADEFRAAYVRCAKLYYETGMRRYTRSLGYVRAKITETSTLIGSVSAGGPDSEPGMSVDDTRLSNGTLDGPSIILAYQADDKAFTAPIEAIHRSALLVLLDNVSAEWTFIRQFFRTESFQSPQSKVAPHSLRKQLATLGSELDEDSRSMGRAQSIMQEDPRSPGAVSETPVRSPRGEVEGVPAKGAEDPEEKKMLEHTWKMIFDPVFPYFQTLITSFLTPTPPLIPLLTMIRLTDSVLTESSKRACTPLEPFLIGLRMQFWPLFQKGMGENVESLKKLADSGGASTGAFAGFGASMGMFGGSAAKGGVDEIVIRKVSARYAALFSSVIALSGEEEEGMLFVNLQRMRTELNRLITTQAQKIKDPASSAAFSASMCDALLTMLSAGERLNIHPKAQAEVAFWREREEEARRRMASMRR